MDTGVGLAEETRQHELFGGASRILADDLCPLIIGQWAVQWSACGMCHKHDANADKGIASRMITSPEATSLNRYVMFLISILLVDTPLAVTHVTSLSIRAHGS
jgi:hypothetical protein